MRVSGEVKPPFGLLEFWRYVPVDQLVFGVRMSGQRDFWDVEHRLEDLSAQGDLLEKLSATVDFEMFRGTLEEAFGLDKRLKSNGVLLPR